MEGLYKYGKTFYEFPYRVTWRTMTREDLENNFRNNVPDTVGSLQMMVTVPKKKRRKAVDRVLLRRRIREAYRLNRKRLKEMAESKLDSGTLSIGFVYIHDKNLEYHTLEDKLKQALEKVQSKLEHKYPPNLI